jgi:hypothetical protein
MSKPQERGLQAASTPEQVDHPSHAGKEAQ